MDQQITVNLNNELVLKAQSVLEKNGVDLNYVLNYYLAKIIKEGFLIEMKTFKDKQKIPSMTMADCWGFFEGQLPTSDDFDEPLDDLMEYME